MPQERTKRISEGVLVIQHPRGLDQPEQGWLRAIALQRYSWYSETQSFLPHRNPRKPMRDGRSRAFYADFAQQGWIRKPTGTLFEAIGRNPWHTETQSFRMGTRPGGRFTAWSQDTSFIQRTLPVLYDPAVGEWQADAPERMGTGKRPFPMGDVDKGWLSGFPGQAWGIPADTYRKPKYWTSQPVSQDWISGFPVPQAWNQSSVLAPRPLYRIPTEPQPAYTYYGIPAAVVFDETTFPPNLQLTHSVRSLGTIPRNPMLDSPVVGWWPDTSTPVATASRQKRLLTVIGAGS